MAEQYPRSYETLSLLADNLKDDYLTYYNSKNQHVSIEKLEPDQFGKHQRIDVLWNDDRRLFDVYTDFHHEVFTSWVEDEDVNSSTLENMVEELMRKDYGN